MNLSRSRLTSLYTWHAVKTITHVKAATCLLSFLFLGLFKVYSRWTHGGLHHQALTRTKDGLYIRLVQQLAAVFMADLLRCQIGLQDWTLRTRLRVYADAEVKKVASIMATKIAE